MLPRRISLVQAAMKPEHGHGLEEGFIGRPLECAGGRVRILVGAAHGKHDVIASHHRLETQPFGALAELADAVGVRQTGDADTYLHRGKLL